MSGSFRLGLPHFILFLYDGDPSHQMILQPTPLPGADHPDTWDHRFVLMPHSASQHRGHKAEIRLRKWLSSHPD
jgi:hypothetical protein